MKSLNPARRDRAYLLGGLTVGRALVLIIAVTVVITLLAGFLMWVVNEAAYPKLGDGMWWALQTVTTVGYGDHLPSNNSGRAIASVVMVTGISFLTVMTATISTALIESARKRRFGDTEERMATALTELHEELGKLRAEIERRSS